MIKRHYNMLLFSAVDALQIFNFHLYFSEEEESGEIFILDKNMWIMAPFGSNLTCRLNFSCWTMPNKCLAFFYNIIYFMPDMCAVLKRKTLRMKSHILSLLPDGPNRRYLAIELVENNKVIEEQIIY